MKARFFKPVSRTGSARNDRMSSSYSTALCPSDGLLLAGKQNLILPLIESPVAGNEPPREAADGDQISLQQ